MSQNKRKMRQKKKSEKIKYGEGPYATVKFIDDVDGSKLFECVPELWFASEEKNLCFWPPPNTKKSVTLLAMKQEVPGEDWEVYSCVLVSEGHATYSIGAKIVRDKITQSYNTSSADEHIQAAQYRREHPGLVSKGVTSFEDVFSRGQASKTNQTEDLNQNSRELLSGTMQEGEENYENQTSALPSHSLRSISNDCRKSPSILSNHSEAHNTESVVQPSNQPEKSYLINGESNRSRRHIGKSPSSEQNSVARSSRSESLSRRSSNNTNNSSNAESRSGSHLSRGSRPSSSSSLRRTRSRSVLSRGNDSSSNRSRSRHGTTRTRSRDGTRSRSRRRTRSRSRRRTRSRSRRRTRSRSRPRSRSRSKHSTRSHRKQRSHSRSERGSDYRSARNNRFGERQNSVQRYLKSLKEGMNKMQTRETYTYRRTVNAANCNKEPSPGTRNRLRVEALYREHERKRASNRSNVVENIPGVSSSYLPSRREDQQHRGHKNSTSTTISNCDSTLLNTLVEEVRDIKKLVTKNNHRFVEIDRRLTRMEVTVNKSFILLGDLSKTIDIRALLGNELPSETKPPKGFCMPKLPIDRLKVLVDLKDDLENKEFYNFLVNHEKQYCAASDATDTVTMTSYLRRFIDVDLRASFVLKDLKGHEGLTLYHNFHKIYLFLVDVMIAGYRIKNRTLTTKDVHVVLRTVWGRSKQTQTEEIQKRRR